MPRILLFANPTAGRGRGSQSLRRLTPALQQAGWEAVAYTRHPATAPAELLDGVDAILIIGGDGTLRTVIERLGELIGYSKIPPVLVIGLGTANLMQRHLGLQYNPATLESQIVALLQRRRTRSIDLATANGKLFLLMASCGLDASIVHQLARVRTGPITRLSYVAPGLLALRDYRFWPMTVTVDGATVLEGVPALVFVGNVPEYGTGFPVLDRANSFDQLLDVCVMPCRSFDELMKLAMLTAIGQHHDHPGVVYTTGQDVRITAAGDAPLQVDGDAAGHTPADIRLLPERVGFIVP